MCGTRRWDRPRRPAAGLLLGLALVLGGTRAPAADPPPKGKEGRVAVGTLATPQGSLVTRTAPGKDWQMPKAGAAVYSGDLHIGLPLADVDNAAKTVRLRLRANVEGDSPFPSVESAVVLHPPEKGYDLDFTLDRGQVALLNTKAKGASKVRVRFRDQKWTVVLKDKDSVVGLDLHGRWLPGAKFDPRAKTPKAPPAFLYLLVVRGSATVTTPDGEYGMTAPPGPASLHWDSVGGHDDRPHTMEKMPAWVREFKLDKEKTARLEKFRARALDKGLPAALKEALASDDPAARKFAVYVSGALDELAPVADALTGGKHPDLWDHAVIALRHWLARAPGQDMALYQRLIKVRKMKPAEAATVVQLLHTFDEDDLLQPETYEALIEGLRNPQLAVRGLAHWHLRRLVPAGRKIPFDPAGTPASHEKAYGAWKKVVPDGKLPPGESEKDKR